MNNDDRVAQFLARLTGRTQDNYRYALSAWRRWLDSRGTPLMSAQRQDVEEWIALRRSSGISARTVCSDLSHLSGLYRWATEEALIPADPTSLVARPRYGRTERPYLGAQDTRRILEASLSWSGGELAAHVHLWALSGLRPGEPRIARVEDLGTHDGSTTLAVSATKTAGRERLALPASTARILSDAVGCRRRGTLLVHPSTGRPWTKAAERARLIRLLDWAGLPQVTPYGLRTGFITHSLAAGIDERLVMISARHTSSAQTARYDRLRDQVERAVGPALERWLSSPQEPAEGVRA